MIKIPSLIHCKCCGERLARSQFPLKKKSNTCSLCLARNRLKKNMQDIKRLERERDNYHITARAIRNRNEEIERRMRAAAGERSNG